MSSGWNLFLFTKIFNSWSYIDWWNTHHLPSFNSIFKLQKWVIREDRHTQSIFLIFFTLADTSDNDGTCWIKTKEELEILIKKKNTVRFIKSQRLWWAAHVIRMNTTRIVKKVTEWEPRSSRPIGRPRLRWLDQVEEDLKMKVRNWRKKCTDRRLWNKIVKQAKTQGL
jgi:hypothetical protein